MNRGSRTPFQPPRGPPPRQGFSSGGCRFPPSTGVDASCFTQWNGDQGPFLSPGEERSRRSAAWVKRQRPDSFSGTMGSRGLQGMQSDFPPPKRGHTQTESCPGRNSGQQVAVSQSSQIHGPPRGVSRDSAVPVRVHPSSGTTRRSRFPQTPESSGHVQADFNRNPHERVSTLQPNPGGAAVSQTRSRSPSAHTNFRRPDPPRGLQLELPLRGSPDAHMRRGEARQPSSSEGTHRRASEASGQCQRDWQNNECAAQPAPSGARAEGSQHFQRSKDKVLTDVQISKRDADLCHTKRSEGYQRYIRAVPREGRLRSHRATWHPVTPCSSQSLSVKQWRDLLSKWRRQVHLWTNLPESVYCRIASMPVKEQVKALGSMTARELDSRDEIHETAAASDGACQPPPNNEPIGRSSEEIARWLMAADVTTGEESNVSGSASNSASLCRPVLFVPSWYRTTLHRRKFDVAHENDFAAAAAELSKRMRGRSSYHQKHFSSGATFMRSVYGRCCDALQQFEVDTVTSTVSGGIDAAAYESSQGQVTFAESEDLPLDMALRLARRQPDLIGHVEGKTCLSNSSHTISARPVDSGASLLRRMCQEQREKAVLLTENPPFDEAVGPRNIEPLRFCGRRRNCGRRRFL